MGVEWAEWTDPASSHVGGKPPRRTAGAAAHRVASAGTGQGADRNAAQGAGQANGDRAGARAWGKAIRQLRGACEKIKGKYA